MEYDIVMNSKLTEFRIINKMSLDIKLNGKERKFLKKQRQIRRINLQKEFPHINFDHYKDRINQKEFNELTLPEGLYEMVTSAKCRDPSEIEKQNELGKLKKAEKIGLYKQCADCLHHFKQYLIWCPKCQKKAF
jgi:hypothetical protein